MARPRERQRPNEELIDRDETIPIAVDLFEGCTGTACVAGNGGPIEE